jgi:tetratricopeptide (TPR) repeat protein
MLALANTSASAQNFQSNQQSRDQTSGRVTNQQSVVVTANLTPEEIEEGQINDVHEAARRLEEQGDCASAIRRQESIVIPMAEAAKFEVPRKKFLFLAHRGIARCRLALEQFAEAEESYQKLFQYVETWPGTNDSAYPQIYQGIGMARMGRQQWSAAEDPLKQAIDLFDEQIRRAVESDSEFMRTMHANNVRMSQDIVMNLLAVTYFRETRYKEALSLLEKAYTQAVQFQAPGDILRIIVANGRTVSLAAGDDTAHAIWLKRAPTSN